MLEDVLVAVGVAERHVAKLDIAVQLLPVFLFGVESVAVLFRDLRRVDDVGFRFQKPSTNRTALECLQGFA